MIFHVLNSCKPVFVNDISTFTGTGSDVQFMRFVLGLKCIACLPLFVANQRILGVLRLGFDDPRGWPEQEKVRACVCARSGALAPSAAPPGSHTCLMHPVPHLHCNCMDWLPASLPPSS